MVFNEGPLAEMGCFGGWGWEPDAGSNYYGSHDNFAVTRARGKYCRDPVAFVLQAIYKGP